MACGNIPEGHCARAAATSTKRLVLRLSLRRAVPNSSCAHCCGLAMAVHMFATVNKSGPCTTLMLTPALEMWVMTRRGSRGDGVMTTVGKLEVKRTVRMSEHDTVKSLVVCEAAQFLHGQAMLV